MKKIFMILIFTICLSSLVLSKQPIQQIEPTYDTLQIAYPKFEHFIVMQDFDFHIHVFNASGIIQKNDTTSCYIHLYNISGNHLIEAEMNFDSNNFDFYNFIDGGNFSYVGEYTVIVWCNNTLNQGGFISGEAIATTDGKETDNSSIYLILGILGVAFLMIYYSLSLNPEKHWFYKIIVSFLFPIFFFIIGKLCLAVSYGKTNFESALIFYNFMVLFLKVYYAYLFLYLLWESLVPASMKEKLEKRFKKWVK